MKFRYFLSLALVSSLLFSCATIQVKTDYDTQANFTNYKTFGFFKPAIDKVEINDLDKKRILRAIDKTMQAKGFTKSTKPDLLVAIDTKAEKNIDVYQNYGFGFGWGWWSPFWWGGNFNNFSTFESVDGVLFIDLIDAQKKELVWHGSGKAPLVDGPEAKEKRIQEIVTSILAKYPPERK